MKPWLLVCSALVVTAQSPDLFEQGRQAYLRKEYAAAVTALTQAGAHDFRTLYLLGAAQAQLGHNDAALKSWRAASLLEPRNAKLLQILSIEYSKGRYFAEASRAARAALALQPGDLTLSLLAIKAHQDAGETEQAFSLAQQAAGHFPQSARAQFEYGFHLQKVGRLEDAYRHLQVAMKLDPAYEEPFFFYGDSLAKQGQAVEAIPYLRAAIRNRPDYIPARVLLARTLVVLEDWPAALAELAETIKRDPLHPQPHLLLSQIYFRQGDEDRARQEKELSLRLRREHPEALEAAQTRSYRPAPEP